jgi:hypothetical protein
VTKVEHNYRFPEDGCFLGCVVWLILANISEELTSFTITVNAYQFLQENLLKIAYLRNENMIGYIKMNLS